jgi:hypothetical protein
MKPKELGELDWLVNREQQQSLSMRKLPRSLDSLYLASSMIIFHCDCVTR